MKHGAGSVDSAIAELRRGRHLMVMDDVSAPGLRRVDMVLSAELVQPLAMATLVRFSSGFVNVALPRERCAALMLPVLVSSEDADRWPLAAVSVDAAEGVTTGISATDRATTARLLADPASTEQDFKRPGHVVPLRVPEGALQSLSVVALEVELCRLAGLAPAAVRSELVHSQGELLGLDEVARVASARQLAVLSACRAFCELGLAPADAQLRPRAAGRVERAGLDLAGALAHVVAT